MDIFEGQRVWNQRVKWVGFSFRLKVLECSGIVLASIDTRCVPENTENEVSMKAKNPTIDATRMCGYLYGRPCDGVIPTYRRIGAAEDLTVTT
ncbi:hypothetical protein F383_02029 [Gossypium arboreum]|uniref:Uncharacterized protein n=1 Tax=Gossypium arboreum TaxID=29729 RepID=A0A0B0PP39_GOSAR|nr:hypothetical protein F383_02029 [Gossypium arboreum]